MAADRPAVVGRRKDGSEFPAEIDLSSIESENGAMIAAAIRDITTRKAGEQELAAIRANLADAIESVQHALSLYDREDRLVVYNRHFLDQFPEIADLVKVGARFEDMFLAAVDRGSIVVPAGTKREDFIAERIARHRHPDGRPILRHLSGKRIHEISEHRSRNGGVVVVGVDVTEQLRTEHQLRETQKMEAIGKLTGGMAHDFNNYLGVIIGNLDLLTERVGIDAKARRKIDAALDGALRASELTQSLLAFARRQSLDPKRIDVNERIAGVATLLKRTLGEDILFNVDLAPDLWPVIVDGALLDSCIVNLANNARDAMPRGGALTIATRNFRADENGSTETGGPIGPGDYALIEVSDAGAGMPPEIAERAFEPFFTTKGPGHGTGLGLSMVHGFIRQSGGHIALQTEVGRGTTVRIYLPRALDAGRGEAAGLSEAQTPDPGTGTILVVEDNAEMRRTTVAQLVQLGYQVVEAANGDEALAALDEADRHIDLLFTDVVMPGRLDGYELVSLAIARRPGIRVLLTSGFPGDRSRSAAGGSSNLRLLAKPYRRHTLAQAIREAMSAPPPAGTPPADGSRN